MDLEEYNKYKDKFYEWQKTTNFDLMLTLIETEQIEEAYKLANKIGGNQLPRDLTMYLLKVKSYPFKTNIFKNINYVPENFLYEGYDENLIFYIDDNITEIKNNAFRYCTLKKLIIPNSVKLIGDSALCLNAGEIHYNGTKQEFIDTFLGKTKCFYKTLGQTIFCTDGNIEIKKWNNIF